MNTKSSEIAEVTIKIDRTRLTHSEVAGLEDAIAVVLDMIGECDRAMLYIQGRSRTLHGILKTLRSGPNAYDPDKEAGQRIVFPRSLNTDG